jgi:hypothetical protein
MLSTSLCNCVTHKRTALRVTHKLFCECVPTDAVPPFVIAKTLLDRCLAPATERLPPKAIISKIGRSGGISPTLLTLTKTNPNPNPYGFSSRVPHGV